MLTVLIINSKSYPCFLEIFQLLICKVNAVSWQNLKRHVKWSLWSDFRHFRGSCGRFEI